MQFLTQLWVKREKKNNKKNTLKAAYEDATARRYGSIHELIVILLARAMYGLLNERGGTPHHLRNISCSLSTMVAAGSSTTLCKSDYSKLLRNSSKIGEFREGTPVNFGSFIALLSAKFRAVRRTVIVKIRLIRTKIWLKTNN